MQHSGIFTRDELDNYFASYVGMEGGNPRASVWICDRSPHPWFERLAGPLRPRTEPRAWDDAFRAKHRVDMGKWLNHQRIARIMAAARAEALGIRLDDNDWKEYFRDQLYAPDGAEFKLNLFPLPMQLDGLTPWSKVFRGQAELVPKERYLELCRHGGRFRFLRTLCTYWRPKVVICIGHRQTDDFVRAFGLDEAAGEVRQLQPADQVRLLHVFVRDGTTWILCPALAGSAGLTSDVQLNAFGKLLGASLEASDFDSFPAPASGPERFLESHNALQVGRAASGLPRGGYPARKNSHADPSPNQNQALCAPPLLNA